MWRVKIVGSMSGPCFWVTPLVQVGKLPDGFSVALGWLSCWVRFEVEVDNSGTMGEPA